MLSIAPSRAPEKGFRLRPYQEENVEAIRNAERRGVRRQLSIQPTGCGKTVTFAHAVRQRGRDGSRSLVLAHRDELLQQAKGKFLMVDPTAEVGVVKAQHNEVDAQVVVGSVQTLARERRLEQLLSAGGFASVVVDEAHHATAPSYRRILRAAGSFSDDGPLTLGFTATGSRGDAVGLGEVFQEIVFERGILEMIEAGYLANLRAIRVTTNADLDAVRTRQGDLAAGELGEEMMRADAPREIVAAFLEHAKDRKALCFTPTVRVAHATAAAFREAGVAAEALDGTTPEDERAAILERLSTGETRVLTNCAVLTEGFDEPSIDCVIVARPTKSKPQYIQQVGRGTRRFPGKEDCLILDVVGSTSRHSVVTAATLFGVSPARLATTNVTRAVREEAEEREEAEGRIAARGLKATVVDPFWRPTLHWIEATGGGHFALPVPNGVVHLARSGGTWTAYSVQGPLREELIAGVPLEFAQGVAEDHARKLKAVALSKQKAPWRKDPASEKQLAAIRRFGCATPDGMSKGEASDTLAMLIATKGGRLSA